MLYIVKIKTIDDFIKSELFDNLDDAKKMQEKFNDIYGDLAMYGAYIEEVLNVKFI